MSPRRDHGLHDLCEAEELIAALGLVGAVRFPMLQENSPLDHERPWDDK